MQKDADIRLLCTTATEMEAQMLKGILDHEGIPNMLSNSAPGGRLYTGTALFGMDVFVAADAYKKAQELFKAYFNNAPTDVEEILDE